MTVREVIHWLQTPRTGEPVALSLEQILACLYLEQRGFRMCVDFGYGNAIEKARADWRSRRGRKIGPRNGGR